MKNFFICFLLVFLSTYSLSAQQYDIIIGITNKVVANGKLTFDVILSSSYANRTVDHCDFYFKYNTTYLTNPTRTVFGIGNVGTTGSNDLSISINGTGDTLDPSRQITTIARTICTVQFDIVYPNSNAPDNIVCGGNGGIFKLNSTNVSTMATHNCIDPSISTLPITLLSFTAKPQTETIVLNWLTTDEKNFKGFDIQRSTDGESFSSIGFKTATGGGVYSNIDNNVTKGEIYYYRLKMIDIDGSFKYSAVQSALLAADFAVKIFPNPTHNNTMLVIENKNGEENKALVQIATAQGQIFATQKLALVQGENISILPTENLPSGIFIIYVQFKTTQLQYKITKF